jgi:diacylglycerol kinase (ATP)
MTGVRAGRAVLVVNAQSREGDDRFEQARAGLALAGVHLAAAHPLHDPDALPDLVRDELARGATQVIVGGGDGTLSCAAGIVAGSEAVMSVLPLGTANDFARGLRLPRDLEGACRVAAEGTIREVDVARAGSRPFLNAASFGISSGLARRLADGELKRRAGPLAYPAAAAAEAAAHEPFRLRLETNGEPRELAALQVVIGNGRYHGGGRLVAPGSRLDDRRLELYAVAAESAGDESGAGDRLRDLLTLARYALLLARGRHLEHPRILHLTAARVAVWTEPPMEINADGEPAGTTPATFELLPARLEVTVPARTA